MTRSRPHRGPAAIEIATEFRTFAESFLAQASDMTGTYRELVHSEVAAATRRRSGIRNLIRFLDELLDGGASDQVLADVWRRCRSLCGLGAGHHRAFFSLVREVAREVETERRANMKRDAVKRHG